MSSNQLLPFMKAVGVGKNGAKNLDRAGAAGAMRALLTGNYHPVTFGAFFMALRYKGETAEELAGFLDAAGETTLPFRPVAADTVDPAASSLPAGDLLNCAGAYDGKARTCNVGVPAALVAVGAGARIALHGAISRVAGVPSGGVPTKFGMTAEHVLSALGVDTGRPIGEVWRDLDSVGIGYIGQPAFHPGLNALLPARCEMGKRTILNTLETLLNPFQASCHLGGFFHDPYGELICNTLLLGCTGFRRATLVKGIEGSDELRPGRMNILKLSDDGYATEVVDSDALGLPAHISELAAPTEDLEERVRFSVGKIMKLLESPGGGVGISEFRFVECRGAFVCGG